MKLFLATWLIANVFVVSIALGALGILLIYALTGGRWGRLLLPNLRACAALLPALAILFLPLLFCTDQLYPWAQVGVKLESHRARLMQPGLFALRNVIYWGLWLLILWRTRRPLTRLASGLSLLGLLFTVSFAGLDWLMTLDPEWSATGFGALFITACLSNGFAATILLAAIRESRVANLSPRLIDFGNLLLMSVLLWAYLDFTQYLITWSGQLPREMQWYEARQTPFWLTSITLVFALHFVVPFLALLFRVLKRQAWVIASLCTGMLAAQALEIVIWSAPSLRLAPIPSLLASMALIAIYLVVATWWVVRALRREPAEQRIERQRLWNESSSHPLQWGSHES